MKTTKYICDKCKKPIDDKNRSHILGGGTLSILYYNGSMGHNKVPMDGWQFHYSCFLGVVSSILEYLK